MVIFVLTRSAFDDVRSLLSENILWVNRDVLSADEIRDLRAAGTDVTHLTYFVDPCDLGAIQTALYTIGEHHPGERIWLEIQPAVD